MKFKVKHISTSKVRVSYIFWGNQQTNGSEPRMVEKNLLGSTNPLRQGPRSILHNYIHRCILGRWSNRTWGLCSWQWSSRSVNRIGFGFCCLWFISWALATGNTQIPPLILLNKTNLIYKRVTFIYLNHNTLFTIQFMKSISSNYW